MTVPGFVTAGLKTSDTIVRFVGDIGCKGSSYTGAVYVKVELTIERLGLRVLDIVQPPFLQSRRCRFCWQYGRAQRLRLEWKKDAKSL